MTTDQQVKLLMSLLRGGKPLGTAAAKAGMSEPTARKYVRNGKLPSELKAPRTWRTREDPFAEVWPEVEGMLDVDGHLEAKAVLEELMRRYPGRFKRGQVRTLQRRFRQWKALHGPDKEVFFPQVREPGVQAQSDFTDMSALHVTIAGEPLPHLCYHFVLPYSNWEWVTIAYSESFEALVDGLQASLWQLGGVPAEHRTDNLSAATHKLKDGGRTFNERYLELLDYYGMQPSRNTPGNAHENGNVESANGHFKRAVDQRLRLRGSRDFADLAAYERFLQRVVRDRNADREKPVEAERRVLRGLPERPLPAFREAFVTVTKWSTVKVLGNVYSVPSRLKDMRLKACIYATHIDLQLGDDSVATFPRLRGTGSQQIDYRHIIESLVRKPGAFANYVWREALFPTLTFRRGYDALCGALSPRRADLEYLRILRLAAQTLQSRVERALDHTLAAGGVPVYDTIRTLADDVTRPNWPDIELSDVDLSQYDSMLPSRQDT